MCECGEGQRTNAIQCIVRILELGALYSYLPDVIVDFVPFAETLFVDAEKGGCANDVFTVGFLLTKIVSGDFVFLYLISNFILFISLQLCVSYQYEMCLFSENVTHYMLKCYKSNMKEDVKVGWDWSNGSNNNFLNCNQFNCSHKYSSTFTWSW